MGIVDRYQQHEIPQVIPVGAGARHQCEHHAVRPAPGAVRLRQAPHRPAPGGRPLRVSEAQAHLQAFAVYLMVVHFVPAQRCVELLASLTGAAPSVGFVHGMLDRAATLLAEVDERIRALITVAYAVCCDGTPLVHDRYHLYDSAQIADWCISCAASIYCVILPVPLRSTPTRTGPTRSPTRCAA
jgi:transposase